MPNAGVLRIRWKLCVPYSKPRTTLPERGSIPRRPLRPLSGGQSRALMIADTALLSESPIVLIDEIENAGVDRRLALNLFLGAGIRSSSCRPMIRCSPFWPVLGSLSGAGAWREMYTTSEEEKECLIELER